MTNQSIKPLTETETAILNFWSEYIRTQVVEPVRPALIYYLMTEMLIRHNLQLQGWQRPARPSEHAVMSIGATSGALSKRRQKWQRIWLDLKKI